MLRPGSLVFVMLLPFAMQAPTAERPLDTERSGMTLRVSTSGMLREEHVIDAPLSAGTIDESVPRVEVVVDLSRMRVRDPDQSAADREEIRQRMLGPDVLDANRFPQARFRSTTIRRAADGQWLVNGTLTLRGVARPIAVTVTRNDEAYRGMALVVPSQFGVKQLRLLGGTVRVNDEVRVELVIVPGRR